jgi:pyruvate,water dikinase
MAARGVLERPEHFALLRDDELDAFVAEPETFRATIAERDALREALEVLEPPFIVAGEVPAIDGWARRDGDPAPALAAGDVLQGLPGCPGTAHGTARVVLDPTEPGDLQLGDVLVAPSTDPSWTPLFTAASAVVVDVGAPISHATIVARELGVPCVISATGATRRIPPGALVEVDGTLGTITVLET